MSENHGQVDGNIYPTMFTAECFPKPASATMYSSAQTVICTSIIEPRFFIAQLQRTVWSQIVVTLSKEVYSIHGSPTNAVQHRSFATCWDTGREESYPLSNQISAQAGFSTGIEASIKFGRSILIGAHGNLNIHKVEYREKPQKMNEGAAWDLELGHAVALLRQRASPADIGRREYRREHGAELEEESQLAQNTAPRALVETWKARERVSEYDGEEAARGVLSTCASHIEVGASRTDTVCENGQTDQQTVTGVQHEAGLDANASLRGPRIRLVPRARADKRTSDGVPNGAAAKAWIETPVGPEGGVGGGCLVPIEFLTTNELGAPTKVWSMP
ncbi:hypothetical protein DFH06DRAFT_1374140 [Mycena polygramma]|nr:hypothetical protein DFH06DRAFT_1374140 [Mycena polygramma]